MKMFDQRRMGSWTVLSFYRSEDIFHAGDLQSPLWAEHYPLSFHREANESVIVGCQKAQALPICPSALGGDSLW